MRERLVLATSYKVTVSTIAHDKNSLTSKAPRYFTCPHAVSERLLAIFDDLVKTLRFLVDLQHVSDTVEHLARMVKLENLACAVVSLSDVV